jgi:hypothetical protein
MLPGCLKLVVFKYRLQKEIRFDICRLKSESLANALHFSEHRRIDLRRLGFLVGKRL